MGSDRFLHRQLNSVVQGLIRTLLLLLHARAVLAVAVQCLLDLRV